MAGASNHTSALLSVESITVAPSAPPSQPGNSSNNIASAAPAMGFPVGYSPAPATYVNPLAANMTYPATVSPFQPPAGPSAKLPAAQQQAQASSASGKAGSLVVVDGMGRQLSTVQLLNPVRWVGAALHLTAGMLQMPGKALRGDLNTPPKAWRKVPRIVRSPPSAPPSAAAPAGMALEPVPMPVKGGDAYAYRAQQQYMPYQQLPAAGPAVKAY